MGKVRNITDMARLFSLGLLCLATFVAAPAWSQIYKWVDENGVINYTSEAPSNRKAEKLDLNSVPVSVINTYKTDQRAAWAKKSDAPAQEQPQSAAQGYTALTILSPQGQDTLHTNTGEIQVSLALSPKLQGGDAISVSLDGKQLPTLRYSLQFNITSDEWQSADTDNKLHQLQVSVVDSSGNPLITDSPVQFYVHRAFVNQPQRGTRP